MGTSLDLGVSGVHCTMRAVVFVLLGAVAINAEAEADPLLVHHTGVGHTVAGVYNTHIPAVHHVAGVHPVHSVAPVAPVVHAGVKHVAGVYSHPFHYNNYMYGKREAEAEPEAEAEADPLVYTNGVVHHTGIHPVHTAVYNHHVVPAVHHGVNHVAGVYNAPVSTVNHVAGVHHVGVGHVAGVHPVHNVVRGVYNTYPYLG